MIPHNIFSSYITEGGYNNLSITTSLGSILDRAEELYGPRDRKYTILGVEFTEDDYPHTWFPDNSEYIVIRITENCLGNIYQAIYQVAHEVIHCLCPKKFGASTYLEEGLATHFAGIYTQEIGVPFYPNLEKYHIALGLTRELLAYNNDIIKIARSVESDLSAITPKLLSDICPDINDRLLDKLTTNFQVDLQ